MPQHAGQSTGDPSTQELETGARAGTQIKDKNVYKKERLAAIGGGGEATPKQKRQITAPSFQDASNHDSTLQPRDTQSAYDRTR